MAVHILDKWHPLVQHLDATDTAVLKVLPGDTVIAECRFVTDPDHAFGPHTTLEEFKDIHWPGHALFGPIHIEGAEPEDILEVRIEDVRNSPWAVTWTRPGQGFLPDEFNLFYLRHHHAIDLDKSILHFSPEIDVPTAPFMGVMAVAPPPQHGRLKTRDPGRFGGNMDWNFLVKGSILYLPVFNPGALFYVGDSHVVQGDGEVMTSAAEGHNTVTLQFFIRKGRKIDWPEAENDRYYATTGYDKDLKKAGQIALLNMINYLVCVKGLSTREEAYCLCSLAVEIRAIELVTGNVGMAAYIPKGIFKSRSK